MAEKRVVCINKAPTHDDTHHHITNIGTGTDAGYSERLPVATVISNLKSAYGDRYYVLGANNAKSWVIVKQCPHCKTAHEIISTTADHTKTDNLLYLSECRL
jgi:hypothetical protein